MVLGNAPTASSAGKTVLPSLKSTCKRPGSPGPGKETGPCPERQVLPPEKRKRGQKKRKPLPTRLQECLAKQRTGERNKRFRVPESCPLPRKARKCPEKESSRKLAVSGMVSRKESVSPAANCFHPPGRSCKHGEIGAGLYATHSKDIRTVSCAIFRKATSASFSMSSPQSGPSYDAGLGETEKSSLQSILSPVYPGIPPDPESISRALAVLGCSREAIETYRKLFPKRDGLPWCAAPSVLSADPATPGREDSRQILVIHTGIYQDETARTLQGAVDYEEVYSHGSALAPVPGGLGSVTTAVLARRVVQAAERGMVRQP